MTKDGLEKEASMLDLSADNQDGFDDTDGQLYTSNSLLFFIREICMHYYERLIAQLGERTINGEAEGSNPS